MKPIIMYNLYMQIKTYFKKVIDSKNFIFFKYSRWLDKGPQIQF